MPDDANDRRPDEHNDGLDDGYDASPLADSVPTANSVSSNVSARSIQSALRACDDDLSLTGSQSNPPHRGPTFPSRGWPERSTRTRTPTFSATRYGGTFAGQPSGPFNLEPATRREHILGLVGQFPIPCPTFASSIDRSSPRAES